MLARTSFASQTAIAVLLFALLNGAACGAPNIYPDPSFEATGEPGVARTGEKAGHLAVGGKNHWKAIGGSIQVEPFARYRVTAYAKAKIGTGTMFAPYCYEWNCYEWAFVSSVPLKTSDRWQRVQTTFVSPYDHMVVHPLAYIDAANSEAWVDDIVVEKIAEPAAVMAEIAAKQKLSADELELLVRWRVAQGDLKGAHALRRRGRAQTRADVATVIALSTKDPRAREELTIEAVQNGSLSLHDGVKRFEQMTEGMTLNERLALCAAAVQGNPKSTGAARGYRRIFDRYSKQTSGPATTAERAASLAKMRSSVQGLLDSLPADSAARRELESVTKKLDEATAALEKQRAALGKCTVKIGGQALGPNTHRIVIPDEPTPQEQHAARDLQYHLELITGRVIPLAPESELGQHTPVAVGKCKVLRRLGLRPNYKSLGLEGIYIRTVGPALVLTGNKRGVLYATYTFLEDYLGCRWFTPDCSTWPTKGTINVPAIKRRYVPPLEYRATDYPNSRDADWAVHNKINGTQTHLDEARGGKITYHHFVHTFNSLIPPQQYFATHPEYFSMINGRRVSERTQLCLTNPEVIELAKQRVRQWIKERPGARIISVSQNDWHNYCQCPTCTALAEKEGSQAGPLIHFVNAIADDIKDDYPNVIIDTLAYQYTRKPPKHVRPRPNVAVRLCSIECCFIHPLETDPYNKSFVKDIVGWSKICNRLHIWDYVINYAHSIMPFPNLFVLKPNIDFFINHGVTGIYEEACYFTKGAELAELRTWIMAKTLWDPSYDTNKAIDEFLRGYYGRAAKPIRDYIDLIQQSAQSKPDLHVRIYSPPSAGYLTPEVLAQATKLFDRAEAAVQKDATLLHRVQVARLPIIYSKIALATGALFAENDDQLVAAQAEDVSALVDRFAKIAHAEGVTRVREGGPLASLEAWLASVPRTARRIQIKRLKSASLEAAVLPELGGRVWRLRHLPSGQDLIKRYGSEGAWDPLRGGYEEYSQADYRSPGWREAYAVTSQSDHSISLEAKLKGGLKLARTIELDPQKPLMRVSSILENTGKQAQTGCLRVHPAFAVQSTGQAAVYMRQADGSWSRKSLANPADPRAEKSIFLQSDDIPAGAWAVVDEAAKIAIVNRMPAGKLSQVLLNWNGADGRVNLELYSKARKLKPGEKIVLEQTYQVVAPFSEEALK